MSGVSLATVRVNFVLITESAALHSVSLVRVPPDVVSLIVLQLAPCLVAALSRSYRFSFRVDAR